MPTYYINKYQNQDQNKIKRVKVVYNNVSNQVSF